MKFAGPMFSGKSTELLRRVRRLAAADHRTFVISFKERRRSLQVFLKDWTNLFKTILQN